MYAVAPPASHLRIRSCRHTTNEAAPPTSLPWVMSHRWWRQPAGTLCLAGVTATKGLTGLQLSALPEAQANHAISVIGTSSPDTA
ncbi:Os10g0204201 [Oryza sativa Japonica Group]|uniref:Os10g0204201 protein n=1 Tax=Oryza sativa subsp. japonica TaxID=39947 RepID=A0A0P0XTN5_ORYSJ|nr:Os10g0204201 [Oryza sativa Japonica Group]